MMIVDGVGKLLLRYAQWFEKLRCWWKFEVRGGGRNRMGKQRIRGGICKVFVVGKRESAGEVSGGFYGWQLP